MPEMPGGAVAAAGAAAAASTGASTGAGAFTAPVVSIDPEHCYTFCGSIQFSSPRSAAIATKMLESKPEVNSDRVSALFEAEGSNVTIQVAAAEREELQAAVKSLYSLISIIPKNVNGE